jgi:hypothetical protein
MQVADGTPTAEDYASVDRAGEELQRRGWCRRYSVNEVVNGWASLVRSVETGYLMTIDEYTNGARGKLPGAGTDYWWETRLPRRLVGELAEDVEPGPGRAGSEVQEPESRPGCHSRVGASGYRRSIR